MSPIIRPTVGGTLGGSVFVRCVVAVLVSVVVLGSLLPVAAADVVDATADSGEAPAACGGDRVALAFNYSGPFSDPDHKYFLVDVPPGGSMRFVAALWIGSRITGAQLGASAVELSSGSSTGLMGSAFPDANTFFFRLSNLYTNSTDTVQTVKIDFKHRFNPVAGFLQVLVGDSDGEIVGASGAGCVSGSRMGSPLPSDGVSSDPVTTSIGNFTESRVDLSGAANTSGLDVERFYNSADETVGLFGPGWVSANEATVRQLLAEDPDAEGNEAPPERSPVLFRGADGRRLVFEYDPATGAWTRPEEFQGDLAHIEGDAGTDDDDVYTIDWLSGDQWRFDESGRLDEIVDVSGQRADLVWAPAAGELLRVDHFQPDESTADRSMLYTEGVSGLVGEVVASDGRTVKYTYDSEGALASASVPHLDPGGEPVPVPAAEVYETNDPTGVKITKVVDPSGRVLVENLYDIEGRVGSQLMPAGDTVTFTYGLASTFPSAVADTRVVFSDGVTSETIQYHHDERGQLVGVTDSDGQGIHKEWADGELAKFTDRRGSERMHVYTADRRLRMVVAPNPDTGMLPPITDPPDATAQQGDFEFTWYWDENPAIDETHPSWSGPGPDRRVWMHRSATGRVTTYEFDDPDDTPERVIEASNSTNPATSHIVSTGDLITSLTDADGYQTTRTYGDSSNPACGPRQLCSTTSEGVTTTYTYDPVTGAPATVTTPDGTTTYSYDASGQLVSTEDPLAAADYADNSEYDS
ncbi:MAG: RHS repeat protein, partial [bacterium]|nr:RHS repeat protein [bacterium]